MTGATGSGKTTTVDIILGLLEPQGTLEVDGYIMINKTEKLGKKAWLRSSEYISS